MADPYETLLPSEDDDGSAATIATLTAERDAALRERDEARGNLGGYVIVGGPQHVALWDAISSFTVASGGRSDAVNGDRMDAVVRVERAVSSMVARGGDDARRSGLTLTAEERAAVEYAGKRCRVGFDRDYPEVVAYVAAIDRLLAGARTVTEPTAEEVEATARALHAMEEKRRRLWRTWDYMDPTAHETYRSIARAAIAAGLDPRRLKEGT